MKKKYVVSLIILFIVILGCLYLFWKGRESTANNNTKNKSNTVVAPRFELQYYSRSNCVTESDKRCTSKSSTYYTIKDYTGNPVLKSVIDHINELSYNYYIDVMNRQKLISECPEKETIYKNRYSDSGMIYHYVNDKLAVIAFDVFTTDLCTNNRISPMFFTYYYDVANREMRDEDWLYDTLKLQKEEVDQKVITNLISKGFITSSDEYKNLVDSKKLRCQSYLNMLGDLVSQCVKTDDLSFVNLQLKTGQELGLPDPFQE